MASRTDRNKLPKIFFVNWFRKDTTGKWLWPGYGENSRVLKWICERVEGTGKAVKTAIGYLPEKDALDLKGLDVSRTDLDNLLSVDVEGWKRELADIEQFYSTFGDKLPDALKKELEGLKGRLEQN